MAEEVNADLLVVGNVGLRHPRAGAQRAAFLGHGLGRPGDGTGGAGSPDGQTFSHWGDRAGTVGIGHDRLDQIRLVAIRHRLDHDRSGTGVLLARARVGRRVGRVVGITGAAEEFEVGREFHHEFSRTVTEMDNTMFSLLTMNPQPLHLDAHFAEKTEYGQRLFNSLYTLGILVGMSVYDTTLGTTVGNLGMTDVRFPKPLFQGDTIRV